jgi:hypothetical protein
MRAYSFLFVLLTAASSASVAQEKQEIPNPVKIQFTEDFVSAMAVSWAQENESVFQVKFYHQSHHKIAAYTQDGTRVRTETQLYSLTQVPAKVARTISGRFRAYSVDQKTKIEGISTVDVLYKFILRKGTKRFEVILHPSGKIKDKTRFVGIVTG